MSEDRSSIGKEAAPAMTFGIGRARILIVDDESLITDLIAEMLAIELQGQSVQVHSAEEAIEALEHEDFHLIISDIRMPGIGGFGLLAWIEANRPDLKQRFLFITGNAGGTEAERMLARLGVPTLQKPFSCANLIEECRNVLSLTPSTELEVQGRCCLAA